MAMLNDRTAGVYRTLLPVASYLNDAAVDAAMLAVDKESFAGATLIVIGGASANTLITSVQMQHSTGATGSTATRANLIAGAGVSNITGAAMTTGDVPANDNAFGELLLNSKLKYLTADVSIGSTAVFGIVLHLWHPKYLTPADQDTYVFKQV